MFNFSDIKKNSRKKMSVLLKKKILIEKIINNINDTRSKI